ncbi:MAG: Gfo/Idh/MocA family oxidoreductase [Ruminococcaceae bacterium]|nr:Gfo/Idh/MocA family oxidoreductase [Oscillospiraceae bacterium]
MQASRKLRIGLLGFGAMGRTHTWAVRNLPYFYGTLPFEATTVGVCTTTAEGAARIANEFHIPLATESEDELIYAPDIDVIDICTPNICHYETLKKALMAGKHVLCEKPITVTAEQAREIAELEASAGSVCGMVFNNRWLAPVMRAKQLVEEGRIGRVLHFHASYLHNSCIDPNRRVGWKQDKTVCGGGVLFDLGSHVIDLIRFLCGDLQAVSGHSQIAYPTHLDARGNEWVTNADEAFYLHALLQNQAHGTIEVSKISLGTNDDLSFEIYGERGSLKFSLMEPNWLYFYDSRDALSPIGGDRGFKRIECVGRYPEMVFPSPKAPAGWLYGHLESMHAYLSAVASETPFKPSLADGAYVQRVMDAAYRSDALGGASVEVN